MGERAVTHPVVSGAPLERTDAPAEAPATQADATQVAPETTAAESSAEVAAVVPMAVPSPDFWPYDYQTVTDPIGNADPTIYAKGSKENNPAGWDLNESASSPGSGDVGDTFVGSNVDETGDLWLYTAFERSTTNGQIGYFLELNQETGTINQNGVLIPVRTEGDLRLTFPANGDNFNDPIVEIWNGTSWEPTTLPAGSWEFQVTEGGTFVEFKFSRTAPPELTTR